MKQFILVFIIAVLAFLLGPKVYQINRIGRSGYGFSTKALDVVKEVKSGQQKIILITGATSGLGFESAKAFASIGAIVLVGGRTMDKAHEATDRLIEDVGNRRNSNLVPIRCSLGSLREVEDCADMTIKLLSMIDKKIDVLMLNAGVAWIPEHSETDDGFELTMAVNHLNQVHLTNRLMDHISPSGRVVVVSSVFHKASSIETMTDESLGMNDWKSGKRAWLAGAPAYADSKLANCIFARALHHHRNMLAFSVHPGEILTNILKPQAGWFPWLLNFFGRLIEPFVLKSPEQGAATQVYCALLASSKSSGGYFQDCNEAPFESEEINVMLNDKAFTKRFLDISEKLIRDGLKKF